MHDISSESSHFPFNDHNILSNLDSHLFKSVRDAVHRIEIATHRQCLDGVCCFLSPTGKKPQGKALVSDSALIMARALMTPDDFSPNARRPDLPSAIQSRPAKFSLWWACEDLQVQADTKNGKLLFALGCRCYEERPRYCKDYPECNAASCFYAQYLGGAESQIRKTRGRWIFALALAKQKFPHCKPFAMSTWTLPGIDKSYFLVPIPWNVPNEYSIVPKYDKEKAKRLRSEYRTGYFPVLLLLGIVSIIVAILIIALVK